MIRNQFGQKLALFRVRIADRLRVQEAKDLAFLEDVPGVEQVAGTLRKRRVHHNQVEVVPLPSEAKKIIVEDRDTLAIEDQLQLRVELAASNPGVTCSGADRLDEVAFARTGFKNRVELMEVDPGKHFLSQPIGGWEKFGVEHGKGRFEGGVSPTLF